MSEAKKNAEAETATDAPDDDESVDTEGITLEWYKAQTERLEAYAGVLEMLQASYGGEKRIVAHAITKVAKSIIAISLCDIPDTQDEEITDDEDDA